MALNIKNLIKESITDYLNELNTQNEEVQEEVTLEEGASDFVDKVTKDGNIYLVKKPTKDMSEGGIVEEVSLKSLIGEGYVGAYLVNTQALAAGKKALKDRDAKLKETIEVGKAKVTELEAKIEELKKTIEDNATRAVHDPQRRVELTETNDSLFAQLEKIENAVEKLKSALEKESPKKAKKEANKLNSKSNLKEFSPHGSIAFSGEKGKEEEKAPLSSLEVGDLIYMQGVSGDNIVVKDKKEDGTVGVGSPSNDKISYQDGNREVQVVRRAYRK